MIEVEHSIIEKVEKELKINFTTTFTYLYISFLFFVFIDITNQSSFFKYVYEGLNHFTVHALGTLFTVITLAKTFKNKQSRQFAWYKFKLIFSDRKGTRILDDAELFDYLSEEEIQKSLISFSKDAREIMIFAGDADFLINNDQSKSPQFDEIKHFGADCKLLLSENIRVDIELLKELYDAGVKIKLYPKSRPNVGLRGRIKITDDGRSAKLFDKIKENYLSQELKNSYMLQMLCQEYNDVFENGRNPFIKYILFDLAGVFCEGDFEAFLCEVQAISGIEIENRNSNYLCIDDRLNLAHDNFTIVDYVEEKGKKNLTLLQKKQVREIWNNTWTINIKMKELASRLKDNGYTIAVCSNCDEDNGDKYLIRNYFDGFDRYFSYEMKILKPTPEYFKTILAKYNCQPYECLFIDDHEKNIDAAKALGFATIKVARTHSEEDKVAKLEKAFNELSIKYNDDENR